MKVELEAKEFTQEEAAEILAAIYRICHGPDRKVDETAQETLLPLLKHYGFLGLVRVLKIVVDSSEMKERVKIELSALWKEHFGRAPTEDELREYGPVLSCLREEGPDELLPMIRDGKEIQAEASRLTNEKHPEQAQRVIESALSSIIPGWWLFWHDYGLCFLRQEGKHQQAIPHYERAIDYNEDDTYVWSCEDLRSCYENLARVDSKWYAAGILYFQGLSERRPQRWIAWRCLAWLMWQSGKTSEAIPIYREAINRQPDHGWHHSCDDLRVCYEQTGRQEEGFEYFSQLADSRPGLWPAWHSLALLAWHHKKDKTLAVEYYRKAIDHHPEGGWYWSWQDMGWCLAELGQLNDADAAYQRAKAINPKSWHTWHALGNLAERRNRLDEAIGLLQEALRLNAKSEWSWVGLGNCHHYASPPHYALAWLAYQQALKVSPGLDQPRTEIEKIEAAGQPWMEIKKLLTASASVDDLHAICIELQIEYAELEGERLKGRVASLLDICRHSGKTGPMIQAIIDERPDLLAPLLGSVPQVTVGTGASTIRRRHLETQHQELGTRYDQLTSKISTLDIDISRETEEFRKQPLVDRRADIEAERTSVIEQLAGIERQLDVADLTPGT
ncbi:MAG: hypothetical protein AUK03_01035 [Anaerolineae bacterium CG2_30_64_16]|nr:MAG: hypothetical protein AUK03_01035 [Anaerolineae bacterium CG2_30_64_16]